MTEPTPHLDTAAEGTGISRPLSENVNLLGALLGGAVRAQAGDVVFEHVEELRQLCKRAAEEGDPSLRQAAADRIAGLDDDTLGWLLRSYSAFFHLVNQAEKREILRINRERSQDASRPRPESIAEAVHRLKSEGLSLDDVLERLHRLDIQPTLTAHPTEARRRTLLQIQRRIAELLAELRRPDATPAETDRTRRALANQVTLLLATSEVRVERPTVRDEVGQGLYFMESTIWDAAPRIHRDAERALVEAYGDEAADTDVPVFLRWRSWIGSDRDGNPNVTPDVTRWTYRRQREAAVSKMRDELEHLLRELSLSERLAPVPDRLRERLAELEEAGSAGGGTGRETPGPGHPREPYRRLVARMIDGLDETTADALRSDLDLIRDCLMASGFGDVARDGRLQRCRVLARTFGLHMAALDVRQHSAVHETAVAALLAEGGVVDDYAGLDEADRVDVLRRELENPRPLLPKGADVEPARDALETFAVIRELADTDPDAVGAYIVSMTHTVSDLLEPMLLAKEAGVWRIRDGRVETPLDFVPLFETIDDLREAGDRLEALFADPVYRRQLAARDRFQEIMLGYSDSNKDGGYWMANWALHRAQASLGAVCRAHDIDFRLFHGRGGTVGRGGGRANRAIGAMPPVSQNGRMRLTEQGEVISFRYSLPGIAHRHAEQLVSATLLAAGASYAAEDAGSAGPSALMDAIAEASMEAYRSLIDDPGFWDWYTKVTPIEQISRLPIASRPVSRGNASEVDFEGLRAIPWVFAWTQVRAIAPGWYGVGTGLAAADGRPAADGDPLGELYREWPFFRTVINNAQREMARARLEITERYAPLAEGDGGPGTADRGPGMADRGPGTADRGPGTADRGPGMADRGPGMGDRGPGDGDGGAFFRRVADEYERAASGILALTGQDELLENSPVIKKSIALRNPYTDVLNLVQVELLRRYRATNDDAERERLRERLFLSINGVAAAMQSTG